MSNPKICPLLSEGRGNDPAPCVGDRCAWYVAVEVPGVPGDFERRCAIPFRAENAT